MPSWGSAALAFHPQEFNVGVDIFGVSNWLRTLQSIPPYWESFRETRDFLDRYLKKSGTKTMN